MQRHISHPGPQSQPRVISQPCSARRLSIRFQPGKSVLEAVAEALGAAGVDSAVIEFDAGKLRPLVYVIPAPSADEAFAAWYSDIRRPDGTARFERVVMSYGRRGEAPFIHCHGIWRHADGFRGAGHLIPHETVFAEEVEATVYALSGAILDQQPDPETNFPLLTPVPNGVAREGGHRAVLVRAKPNTDIHAALEEVASRHGIRNASIHGIGSLVGCDFVDGRQMVSYASELFIREGRIDSGEATIDIGVVGIDAEIFEGEILRGGNVICIACELLIVEA
ncbi:PCC domain-containing protein [Ensifer adhaerens]|uniref:PCC domain-containing protein n=1 Tax=Ensifer adhaerens TaxID=106592 RepID=UPI0039C92983